MSSTNGNVIPRELYPTPLVTIDALLKKLTFKEGDTFLEPCRGTDAIYSKVDLPEHRKYWAELSMGVDYLETPFDKVDVIITNPPFTLTEEFLRKSLSELSEGGTLAYLQRVNYLGSIKRVPLWEDIGFPNKTPIIVPRPRFVNGGSDSCEYCWFIWDRGDRFDMPEGMSHLLSDSTTLKL